ncbi:MAG: cysteine synthase A [bacterium]|nr:MAG: cysteine synthase A [bacterium]
MFHDLTETIGRTPIVPLKNVCEGCNASLAAKLEGVNPGGSVKDRIARSMIEQAEADGLIEPGGHIVEPTSGNTGIGLALVAAVKGYSLTVTMPASMSIERRRILAAYGAEVVVTSADRGMDGAVAEARRIAGESSNTFMPMQFTNKANPAVHRLTTGPEIWDQTEGRVDSVVCGVGTGGTITGIGEYLKSKRSDIAIIAVEPAESCLLSGGEAGPHIIEGIGPGFIPEVLNRDVIDEIVTVTGDEALETTRRLAREEGIFAGISSGAALAAALEVAGREENGGKLFVVIFPDRGEKYLSTKLWG